MVEQVYFFIAYLANSSFNSAKRSLKIPKAFSRYLLSVISTPAFFITSNGAAELPAFK